LRTDVRAAPVRARALARNPIGGSTVVGKNRAALGSPLGLLAVRALSVESFVALKVHFVRVLFVVCHGSELFASVAAARFVLLVHSVPLPTGASAPLPSRCSNVLLQA